MKKILGAIDLGSNSVRLLVARCDNGALTPLHKARRVTRLGEQPGLLSARSVSETLDAVNEFSREAKARFGDIPIFAFATSAVREAKNKDDLLAPLEHMGVAAEVLSGEREAELSCSLISSNGGCVDIGGGSTEIMYRHQSAEPVLMSFRAGAVRAKAMFGEGAGVLPGEFYAWLDDVFAKAHARLPQPVYGAGGTITTLAEFASGRDAEGQTLSLVKARALVAQIGGMTPQERKASFFERADIVLYGAGILVHVMERFEIVQITATHRDNLYAYLETTSS